MSATSRINKKPMSITITKTKRGEMSGVERDLDVVLAQACKNRLPVIGATTIEEDKDVRSLERDALKSKDRKNIRKNFERAEPTLRRPWAALCALLGT